MTTRQLALTLALCSLGACAADTGLQSPPRAGDPGAPAAPADPAPTGTIAPAADEATAVVATGQEERAVPVYDVSTPLDVLLDASTVLCSSADYSATFLKILIPQIADLTVFDHRNAGASAPCIAAGACSAVLGPANIIDPAQPDDTISLRVLRTQHYAIDHDAATCTTWLREELFTTIRGVAFYHMRQGDPAAHDYADCLAQ